jgi:hypothetical protein
VFVDNPLKEYEIVDETYTLYKREPKGCVQISIYHLLLQLQLVEETRGPRENHRPIASHHNPLKEYEIVDETYIEANLHAKSSYIIKEIDDDGYTG